MLQKVQDSDGYYVLFLSFLVFHLLKDGCSQLCKL